MCIVIKMYESIVLESVVSSAHIFSENVCWLVESHLYIIIISKRSGPKMEPRGFSSDHWYSFRSCFIDF